MIRLARPKYAAGGSRWVAQQANDPFVAQARKCNYVSRAAFKLSELDDKFSVLSPSRSRDAGGHQKHRHEGDRAEEGGGVVVVDLGAAPGSWSQVICQRLSGEVQSTTHRRTSAPPARRSARSQQYSQQRQHLVVGVDLNPLVLSAGQMASGSSGGDDAVTFRFIQGDFTSLETQQKLLNTLHATPATSAHSQNAALSSPLNLIDVVTSDMCPNRAGGTRDRLAIASLNEKALLFALRHLKVGGNFVCKVLGSPNVYPEVYNLATEHFLKVRVAKPAASRSASDENFLVALSKLPSVRQGRGAHEEGKFSSSFGVDRTRAGGSKSSSFQQQQGAVSFGLDDWPGFHRRSRR